MVSFILFILDLGFLLSLLNSGELASLHAPPEVEVEGWAEIGGAEVVSGSGSERSRSERSMGGGVEASLSGTSRPSEFS